MSALNALPISCVGRFDESAPLGTSIDSLTRITGRLAPMRSDRRRAEVAQKASRRNHERAHPVNPQIHFGKPCVAGPRGFQCRGF